jgi:hypothetical protein
MFAAETKDFRASGCKPLVIEAFDEVRVTGRSAPLPRAFAEAATDVVSNTVEQPRLFVIVMDDVFTADRSALRRVIGTFTPRPVHPLMGFVLSLGVLERAKNFFRQMPRYCRALVWVTLGSGSVDLHQEDLMIWTGEPGRPVSLAANQINETAASGAARVGAGVDHKYELPLRELGRRRISAASDGRRGETDGTPRRAIHGSITPFYAVSLPVC